MTDGRLRLMTYNVHGCIGTDGRHEPERIAEVIAAARPDVVALQELDVGRRRTGGIDQPARIARQLDMHFYFSPAWVLEEGHYGNAILSRLPLRVVREGALPGLRMPWRRESRGALWAAISWTGRDVHVIATHLGLLGPERALQSRALLGHDWLGSPRCRGPRIVCGDLNSAPGSAVHRQLGARLRDAADAVQGRAVHTFPSIWPILRIDHVFLSSELVTVSAHVPRTPLSRLASDHLPFVVEVRSGGGDP